MSGSRVRFAAAIALPVVTAVVTAGAAVGSAPVPGSVAAPLPTASTSVATHPSPAHFTHGRVDNPWFPLRPGNRLVYRGSEDGHRLRDVFLVTHRTARIDGVVCRVVQDRLFQDGVLRERTTDWYAQTTAGTVWYFGEATAELDRHGHVVSREGSFRAGRDGAEAGVFMPAHPAVGQSFQQEDSPGQAEDRFTIVDLHATVSVPVLGSTHAMLTRETTVLEPGVVDHKYYVRDIGTVREVTVKGGSESLRLVSVSHVR
jgi:hypothetical protein